MTDQPHELTPSETIGPETLDQALLALVVRRDGTAVTFVSSDTDRDAVADWLIQAAEEVRAAPVDCVACRDGSAHTHDGA